MIDLARHFIAIVLGISFLFSVVAYVSSVYDRTVAGYHQRVQETSYNLELYLNGRLQALRVLAEQPELRTLEPAVIRPRLVQIANSFRLSNAAVFDETGFFLTSVDLDHPRLISDYQSFKQALAGTAVISNRIERKGVEHLFISLRVPISNEEGRPIAVLTAGITNAEVARTLKGSTEQQNLELCVLDGNRQLVYHDRLKDLIKHEKEVRDFFTSSSANQGFFYGTMPFESFSRIFLVAPVRGTDWMLFGTMSMTVLLLEVLHVSIYGIIALTLIGLSLFLGLLIWCQKKKYRSELEVQRMENLAAISQLAAGIAHEVRNPLTSIKGFIQMAVVKPDKPINVGHMQLVLEEITRIEQLINEFRMLARPQEVPHISEVDLNATIDNIITLVQSQAHAKSIELSYTASDERCPFIGDASLLKQLWLNLLRNAVEAVPDGGKIEVYLCKKECAYIVSIKDNGAGIPPEVLRKLGTPFFTTKESGTGLGLSICYNIVHKHHGRLEFSSKVGEGTEVLVHLPRE